MQAEQILAVFQEVVDGVQRSLAASSDRGLSGNRDGQYVHDVAADSAAVDRLISAGFGVFSEESGLHYGDREYVVVVDPIDGSTNAARGVPWYATSLCAVRDGRKEIALVVNLATDDRFSAIRGLGAWRNAAEVSVRTEVPLSEGIIALSGYPTRVGGWEQFRAFGACALDMSMVAAGVLDGFADADDAHGAWDYLAAALIVEEAGGTVADAFGRDLIVLDLAERRAPVAATGSALLEELVEERRSWDR